MTNSDYNKLQSRLEALPPATLAKALLNLTFCSDEATQVVETLTTSPEEAVASFKRKLSGIKRRRRFYHRTDARLFASELEALLQLLDKPAIPPTDALAALALFFEADGKFFEMADDSYGDMGSVFCHTATTLFVNIAKRIEDQALLIKTVKKLYTKNEYGARDCIADHAAEFLTSESLESLHAHYSSPITIKDSDSQARILTKALAAQLKNPEQYEAELRQHSEHYYTANICELASVYQAADRHQDLAKRLDEWLTLVRDCDFSKLQNIAVDTYIKIGQPDKAKTVRTNQFLYHPSRITLDSASEFASKEELQSLKQQVRDTILAEQELSHSHLRYLLETGDHLLANAYLLDHHSEINGDSYSSLIDSAKSFESSGYPLASSLIWRALAKSILERAYSKAYPYAARYIKSLHSLAPSIDSWLEHPDHAKFLSELHQQHYRKSSFWKHIPEAIQQLAQS